MKDVISLCISLSIYTYTYIQTYIYIYNTTNNSNTTTVRHLRTKSMYCPFLHNCVCEITCINNNSNSSSSNISNNNHSNSICIRRATQAHAASAMKDRVFLQGQNASNSNTSNTSNTGNTSNASNTSKHSNNNNNSDDSNNNCNNNNSNLRGTESSWQVRMAIFVLTISGLHPMSLLPNGALIYFCPPSDKSYVVKK